MLLNKSKIHINQAYLNNKILSKSNLNNEKFYKILPIEISLIL